MTQYAMTTRTGSVVIKTDADNLEEAINYFAKIFERIDNCKVILYNYEKLCGYKFSVECIKQLKDNLGF